MIARWAALRDECIRRYDAPPSVPETMVSLTQQAAGDGTELMISLYNRKLTYAEFGRKTYAFSKSMGAFILALTQANAGGGSTQDLVAAQQQFTDTMDAFNKYVHTVSARKPKTVRLSATHS